jgi:hypothetical protein
MAPSLCSILNRLAQLVDVLLGIVILLLPQVQQIRNLALVLGAVRKRRRAPKDVHQYGLELAADRRVARSVLRVVEDIVDEVEEVEASSLDRGLALCCCVWPRRCASKGCG